MPENETLKRLTGAENCHSVDDDEIWGSTFKTKLAPFSSVSELVWEKN